MAAVLHVFWVLVPAWAARLSRPLGFVVADGAEFAVLPGFGIAVPIAALLFGIGGARFIPGRDSAFTGSLEVTLALLIAGAVCGNAGWWAVVGFALGDATSGHHPLLMARGPLATTAGLSVSYGVLFALVVGVPIVARSLAASLLPRPSLGRAVIAGGAGAGLAYAWSQAAPILIRPLFLLSGELPKPAVIAPIEMYSFVYAAVAALAIGAFAVERTTVMGKPGANRWIEDSARARSAAARTAVAPVVVAAIRAAVLSAFFSGMAEEALELATMFAAAFAVLALNELTGTFGNYVRLAERVPLAVRFGLSTAAGMTIAYVVVPRLFERTIGFQAMLYAIGASLLVTAVVFPPTRRGASAAATILIAAAIPLPARAYVCVGFGECIVDGRAAAHAAIAIAVVGAGGFVLAAAAAAESLESGEAPELPVDESRRRNAALRDGQVKGPAARGRE